MLRSNKSWQEDPEGYLDEIRTLRSTGLKSPKKALTIPIMAPNGRVVPGRA